MTFTSAILNNVQGVGALRELFSMAASKVSTEKVYGVRRQLEPGPVCMCIPAFFFFRQACQVFAPGGHAVGSRAAHTALQAQPGLLPSQGATCIPVVLKARPASRPHKYPFLIAPDMRQQAPAHKLRGKQYELA
jgi:hypothetical protein